MKPRGPYWYEVQQALVLMGWASWLAPPWQEILSGVAARHGAINMQALLAPIPLAAWSILGMAIGVYRTIAGLALNDAHRATAAGLSFTIWFMVTGCMASREPLSTGFPVYAGLALMSAASLWGLRRVAR